MSVNNDDLSLLNEDFANDASELENYAQIMQEVFRQQAEMAQQHWAHQKKLSLLYKTRHEQIENQFPKTTGKIVIFGTGGMRPEKQSMMDWLYPRVGNASALMVPNPLYLDAPSNESNKTDSTPPSEEST